MIQAVTPFLIQKFIWLPTRFLLNFFGHLEVRGLENLDNLYGSVVFVSNHQSELDPILLPAALQMFSRFSPMFFVSREKSFYKPVLMKRIFYGGFFFELLGAHPADVGYNNFLLSLKSHLEILRRGYPLFIFPEGRKSKDGILQEGKGGAAFLADQTGSAIVPLAIKGVLHITPWEFFGRKRHISVSFGRPIFPKELFGGKKFPRPHDYRQAVNKVVMKKISELQRNSY